MIRVPEETSAAAVTGVLGSPLVAVISRTGDQMRVWPGKDTFNMLHLKAPVLKPLERKAMGQKLRKKNQKIKSGKRCTKYW